MAITPEQTSSENFSPSDPQRDLLRRFQEILLSGGSLQEVAAHFQLPNPEPLPSLLLHRAALARTVDRALFDQVLTAGIDSPSFDIALDSNEVKRTGAESWSVREVDRKLHFSYWSEHREDLRQISARFEQFYTNAGTPFDAFLHSLFSEPEKATARFLERYQELDRAFALSGCEALLRLVGDRVLILTEDLREALNEREQYLRSRTLFAEDYYRTVVHLKRVGPAAEFEEFLKSPDEWILHLHGGGGVGKTVFLRWLIARRCIPQQQGIRIPVARIDMDAFDRRGLGEYPKLIFLPLMKQLTQQLPLNPFKSYLLTLSDCEAMLLRPNSRETVAFRSGLRSKIEAQGSFISNLQTAMASAIGTQNVLVVIDTIEDMLLHQRAQLLSILQLLAGVREKCPGFRLVLSGRYDLCERNGLPEFAGSRAAQVRVVRIWNFTETESKQYLTDLRKIYKPRLVDAIWRKSKGHPLDLTLLGDIVTADPAITANHVRRLPQQYARLIERIIDRIPDEQRALRWLVRYAVVPRHLDLDYVLKVINKPVSREAGGHPVRDDTRKYPDARAQQLYGHQERWKPLEKVELKKAWSDLQSYAAQTSWVLEDGGAIRLQPEVVEPMRELLRVNPIYQELQLASQRYFEATARKRQEEWGEWIAEAIYHCFQNSGARAGEYWQKQLRAAHKRGFADVEKVAGVIFGSEFLDEKGRPKLDISRAEIARASYDLAYCSLVRLLRVSTRHPDFRRLCEELRQRWNDLQRYNKFAGASVPRTRRALIQAADLAFNGRQNQQKRAFNLVANALPYILDHRNRLAADLLATRLLWLEPTRSRPYFKDAYAIARLTKSRDLPSALVDLLLARNYLFVDQLEGAARHFLRAWENLDQAGDALEPAGVFRRTAEALYEAGDFPQAKEFQRSVRPVANRRGVMFQWLHAESKLRLKLGAMDAAQDACQKASLEAKDAQQLGVQAELEAEIEASRYQLEPAVALFAKAEGYYSQAGSPTGINTCRLKTARMFLERAGDANRCREILASASDVLRTPQLRIEALQLDLRAWARMDRVVALGKWKQGIKRIRAEEYSPRARATFLALGLALGMGREEELTEFLSLLSSLRPRSAVFGILQQFELFTQTPWAGSAYQRIERHAPVLHMQTAESILVGTAYANALHFFGQTVQATKLLTRCVARSERFPVLEARARAALWRLAPAEYPLRSFRTTEDGLIETPADPFRISVFEEAERAFGQHRSEEASQLLELCGIEEWPPSLRRSEWGIRANLLSALLSGLNHQQGRRFLLSADEIAKDLAYTLPEWACEAIKEVSRKTFSETDLAPVSTRVTIDGTEAVAAARLTWSYPDGTEVHEYPVLYKPPENTESVTEIFSDPGFGARILGAGARPGQMVQLSIGARHLEGLPWEAGLLDQVVYRTPPTRLRLTDTIRQLQAGLLRKGAKIALDGILGPTTSSALRKYCSDEPLKIRKQLLKSGPPTGNILIVKPDLEVDRFAKRGHGSEGLRAESLYRKHKLQALEHPYRYVELLRQAIEKSAPTIVHLVTGFWQSNSGDVLPDIGNAGEFLMPHLLASVLERKKLTGRSTIVIIECVTPPSAYEVVLQGQARNRFCADLFGAGNLTAVLAIGLWPRGGIHPSLAQMIEALARPTSIGELFRAIPSSSYWSHALFTTDPQLPVWEP